MKKLLTVFGAAVLFCLAGYFVWNFFDDNYREYNKFAQIEIEDGEQAFFMDELFVKATDSYLNIYKLENDGAHELMRTAQEETEVLYSLNDFLVAKQNGEIRIYYEKDGEIENILLDNEKTVLSAKQYGEMLVIRTLTRDKKVKIYTLVKKVGLSNITDAKQFVFCDYCVDYSSGNEYYISYEATGEYIKLILRMFNNGEEKKKVELDNIVYNSFDYIYNMFVFYTDDSLLAVNTDTLIKRTFNCYDIENLQKFVFDRKIAFFIDDAYFNGVNNMLVVNTETNSYYSLNNCGSITSFGDKLLYLDGNQVKVFAWGDTLLDDNILYYGDNLKAAYAMGDKLAVVSDKEIVFLKK